MTNILISGARAPVALELARNIHVHRKPHTQENKIILVDSLRFPLARNTRAVTRFYRIPSPKKISPQKISLKKTNSKETDNLSTKHNIQAFQTSLIQIIKQEKIDLFIPTCEEVFFVAAIKPKLEQYCQVFCPDFDLIKKLHSKADILTLCEGLPVSIPKTHLLSASELCHFKQAFHHFVLKKEFCRFGTGVVLEPTQKKVTQLIRATPSQEQASRFLLQEKLVGQELCAYAIAQQGHVTAEAIYEPIHKVKLAAGIYFKPINHQAISDFIKAFCQTYNYTGQISFDLIVKKDDLFILECNPRATSGLHLLQSTDLLTAIVDSDTSANALEKRESANDKPSNTKSKMIKLAMLLIGLPIAIRHKRLKAWYQDYAKADDVIYKKEDRGFFFFSLLSLGELIWLAAKNRTSLRAASTSDIEWDGENLPVDFLPKTASKADTQ